MVKLTVKTIKGKKFQIEVEQTQTVSGNGVSLHVCFCLCSHVCSQRVGPCLPVVRALHGVNSLDNLQVLSET